MKVKISCCTGFCDVLRRGEERRGEERRGEARRGEARRGEARREERRTGGKGRSEQRREFDLINSFDSFF